MNFKPTALVAALSGAALLAFAPAALAITYSWTSGSFSPGVTSPNPLPVGDTLALSSGSTKTFDALSFSNQGTMTWINSGGIALINGATLNNQGLIERSGSSGAAGVTAGAGGGTLVNDGSIVNLSTGSAGLSLALTGGTLVNNGTLDNQSNGTLTLPSGFTNTGTLTGRGAFSIAGTGLVNSGTIAPGSGGIGALKLSNSNSFAQTASGSLAIDIISLAAHDFLEVAGSGFGDAALNGTLALNCLGACSLTIGDEITILQAFRTISGSFSSVTLGGFATGAFAVIYDIGPGSDFVRPRVTETVSAVPEPGSYALWQAGLGAVGFVARRRRRG